MQNTEHLSSELLSKVKTTIIDAVNLHHVDPQSISPDTSLREGGLELDSVDLLEVIVTIEHKFNVKVADAEAGKKYFKTVGTIVDFIQQSQPVG